MVRKSVVARYGGYADALIYWELIKHSKDVA